MYNRYISFIYIFLYFSEKRKEIHNSIFKKYICFALLTGSIYIINIIGDGNINLLFVPILYWTFILLMFKGKIIVQLIYFIIAFSIIWGCECLFAIILGINNNIYITMSKIPLELISLKFLTYIIFTIVEQLIGKKDKKMDNIVFSRYVFITISDFGMMMAVFYSDLDISDNSILKFVMIVCFALMFIRNIIVFYTFNQYIESTHNNMKQQILLTKQEADLNYYKQITQVHSIHNEIVHNTKYYLGIILQFAKSKDYESIIKIIMELGNQVDDNEMSIYSNDYHILNAILSEKKKQAVKNAIEFDVYIEPGIVLTTVSDTDLIAMLENLLDNALRAAAESKDSRYVKVYIFMQEIGAFCVIKIINGFCGKIIMKDEEFKTTKTDSGLHGIGIKSVNRMAEKYGGYLTCSIKENIFEAVLLLSSLAD